MSFIQNIYPAEYEGHLDRLLIDSKELSKRIKELAVLLNEDYKHTRPVLLCTLKGACPFYVHLTDALQDLQQGYEMEFVRASSYKGTSTTGKVKLSALDPETLRGRHVVIVEDILDTGTTLFFLVSRLKEYSPASIEICTLLDKRMNQPKKYSAKYIGFSVPDHFIVGYGIDYNQLYRDLKDICVISKIGLDFDAGKLCSL